MKKIFPIVLIFSLSLFSCVKEGPRGPEGFPGQNGSDGADGSSPTLYYFDIPISNYSKERFVDDQTQFYNDTWLAYGYIEGVTIQEQDLVMVYMHQTTDGGTDNYFQALPYLDYVDNSTDFVQYTYGVMDDNGDLVFGIRRDDGSAPFDNNASWEIQYNVYIIKGSQNRNAEIPSSINLENEETLKEYLNITERKKVNFIAR